MSGFLYAIPDVTAVSEKTIADTGLEKIFKGRIFTQRQVGGGPEGKNCIIITAGEESEKLYYKPSEQTWQKSLNGKYYIGFYNDDKPGPDDLRRKENITGHKIKIYDNQWSIPPARLFAGGTELPQALLMGENGELVREIIPEFIEFSKKAERLWQHLEGVIEQREKKEFGDEQLWLLAAEAIGINYYVDTDEINILRLITTESLTLIIGAVLDLQTLNEIGRELSGSQKKTTD